MTTISGTAHDAPADYAHNTVGQDAAGQDVFSTDTTGLPAGVPTETVDLSDGDVFDLRVAPVTKQIGDATVRMLAYNGSIPGPTLLVRQGTEVGVNAANDGDLETTVHWHGLRLDNRFDGTHHTQDPIEPGGAFGYRIAFPDPGVYWYHPHIRQDYGQEMGLYGTIVVEPADSGYWPPANREITLTLDDILLTDGAVAPFSRSQATHTAMGRFGDVLLVNGEPDLTLTARAGEVVRLYLVNTANTRVFNVAIPGARMKLVGGDSGRYEHSEFVQAVMLAPSERVVVDVQFAAPGGVTLEHRTPDRTYRLAEITVTAERVEPDLADQFDILRTNADMVAERQRITPVLTADPDKTVAFVAEMDMNVPDTDSGAAVIYACPMHPEVTSTEPARCPDCGMKLLPTAAPAAGYACPMHPEVTSTEPARCPDCGMKLLPAHLAGPTTDHEAHAGHGTVDAHEHHGGHESVGDGVEWEDDMVEVNRMTTPANMRWILIDRDTGERNHGIDWRFRVGDQVKVRLVNEMDSDHPMHHPFHVHGAGRFLILSRDGAVESNLVWKDTVLVRRGETVDILLDVSNPGVWMAHCHIAEHHESGMMFNFHVDEPVR
jgi:FtsP/CotA-like multicopper oxidase with cupredoxin domain